MIRRLFLSDSLILLLVTAYFVAMIPLVPGWLSVASLGNVLTATLPLLVIAVGQMFVLIIAGIDLSIIAVIGLASVVGASIMSGDSGFLAGSSLATPTAILAMLLTGALIGLLNGLSVVQLRMPSFMVTLATGTFFAGLAIWYNVFHTSTSSIAGLPSTFTAIAGEPIRYVPNFMWIAICLALLAHFLLTRTVFGRSLYAIGINPLTARVSGVRVKSVSVMAYVLCGLYASAGAIMYTAQQETGDPEMGQRILLDVIGAAVIGGTSLFGGKGWVLWTIFGVLFLTFIDTSLTMLGMSDAFVRISKGGVILFAATLDAVRSRLISRA